MATFLSLVQKIKKQYDIREESKSTNEDEVDASDLVTADDLYLYPEARTLRTFTSVTERNWVCESDRHNRVHVVGCMKYK